MLMLSDWFLTLAVAIASFSYFLGLVLLNVKPVYPAIKNAAVDLVEDGYKLVVTLFVLDFIIFMVNSAGTFFEPIIEKLCGDAEAAMKIVVDLQTTTVMIVAVLGIAVFIIGLVKLLLSRAFMFVSPTDIRDCMMKGATASYQVSKVLAPLSTIYGLVLLVQAFFIIFIQVIAYNWFLLAGLGVLLYILPFKIGWRSGRLLLSFSLIAYLMIPLYAKMEQIFRNWLSQTYWFTAIFPVDLVVFKIMFPIMYFGFVAWLTMGVGFAAFNVMGMSPGLDWRKGIILVGREIKAVAGLIPKGGGKEEKEGGEGKGGGGPPPSGGEPGAPTAERKGELEFRFREVGEGGEEGETAGKPRPPEEGGRVEGAPPTPPSEEEERPCLPAEKEEVQPTPLTEPARRLEDEKLAPPSEKKEQPAPLEELPSERIPESEFTQFREVDGTRFTAHRAIPEQDLSRAVEVFRRLPQEEKQLVNLVQFDPFVFQRVHQGRVIAPAADWYDSTREMLVHGSARESYEAIIPHEVGHAIYRTDMTPEERLEWRAVYADWRSQTARDVTSILVQEPSEYAQKTHALTSEDEGFAYAYSKYRSGEGGKLPERMRTFIDKRLQERMRTPYGRRRLM